MPTNEAAPEDRTGSYGPPEIFNTDQGSRFTSPRFVDVLQDAGVRVSMDGRGWWMDNVFSRAAKLSEQPAPPQAP